MNFKEKALEKYTVYKTANYECTDIFNEDGRSYFYSTKDNVHRKHVFTDKDITVNIVDKLPIMRLNIKETPIVEEPVIEEQEPVNVEIKQEEITTTIKSSKKKTKKKDK